MSYLYRLRNSLGWTLGAVASQSKDAARAAAEAMRGSLQNLAPGVVTEPPIDDDEDRHLPTVDGRPISDFRTQTPEGWSTVVGWLAVHQPTLLEVMDWQDFETFAQDRQELTVRCRQVGISPVFVPAPPVYGAQYAEVPSFPDWLISSYFDEFGEFGGVSSRMPQ